MTDNITLDNDNNGVLNEKLKETNFVFFASTYVTRINQLRYRGIIQVMIFGEEMWKTNSYNSTVISKLIIFLSSDLRFEWSEKLSQTFVSAQFISN